MPTLLDYLGVSRIRHWSPALLCGSPYLPDKSSLKLFCALVLDVAHFFLKTWIFLACSTVSGAFLHVFSQWQRLFLASTRWFRILIVCTSCKTAYNVLSHSYWGLGQFCGGRGSEKKDSLPILGLQRLASLLMGKSLLPIRYFVTFVRSQELSEYNK